MLLTAVMAPALKSHFETTINMKQNNLTFGRTIHLKKKMGRLLAGKTLCS
jgi:hypothetical protein